MYSIHSSRLGINFLQVFFHQNVVGSDELSHEISRVVRKLVQTLTDVMDGVRLFAFGCCYFTHSYVPVFLIAFASVKSFLVVCDIQS